MIGSLTILTETQASLKPLKQSIIFINNIISEAFLSAAKQILFFILTKVFSYGEKSIFDKVIVKHS